MPLNISIDVDGTILDENERLVPQARESLQRLKDAGHSLQLWSGGGGEYAEKIARKFNLSDLFDSYAKKIDVAIDDLPETAHPLVVIHVDQEHRLEQAVERFFSLEQNVDATLALSSRLIRFVAQLQAEENSFREKYQAILYPRIPLHPIPFFGVIENARVITVGLNPSPTEFTEAYRWLPTYTPHDLTRRLVDYFRLPHTTPHHWFAELQWSLEKALHCPYHLAAAHVDVSPWATHAPSYLKRNSPHLLPLYNELLADGIQNWLPEVFKFCDNTVKLVIICPTSNTPGQVEAERLPVIRQKILDSLGPEWGGEILIRPKNQVPRWAWENRERIIQRLGLENVFP